MSDYSYNLIDEPWITCTSRDGTKNVGLRELLLSAHELRGIESPNPLFVAALLRVLLALVHRIADGPKTVREWRSLYTLKQFSEKNVDAYFQKVHDRFDLFSDSQPFYQTPGLTLVDLKGNPSPISVATLMVERASGNNKTIFDHTTDETVVTLTPSEAASALITAQNFSLGGIYRKTSKLFGNFFRWENAVMVDGINVVLTGESLFETIMLNLLIYADNEPMPRTTEDCPVWERSDIGKAIGSRNDAIPPKGYLDYLTCKCRHILLIPKLKDGCVVVENIHTAPGELFVSLQSPGFITKANKKGVLYHPQLDVARLAWRDSLALFAFDDDVDNRPKAFRQAMVMQRKIALSSRYQCMVIALANEDANPLAWRKEVLSIPLALLENKTTIQTLKAGMSRAEDVEFNLKCAVKTFMKYALPANSKDTEVKTEATGFKRFYWDRLETHFHSFLFKIASEDTALSEWYGNIASVAHEALKSCVRQRYADSAATLKGWAAAVDELNRKLATLNAKQGGGNSEGKS